MSPGHCTFALIGIGYSPSNDFPCSQQERLSELPARPPAVCTNNGLFLYTYRTSAKLAEVQFIGHAPEIPGCIDIHVCSVARRHRPPLKPPPNAGLLI
jgi:hypothetical protein